MATWTQTAARSASVVMATTEAAPTLATDGVPLSEVGCILPVIHAPQGQTFDGTGTLLGYVYTGTAWVRAPRADVDMSDCAGLADVALPALPVLSPRQRFMLVPNGVGLSGGATVTVDYFCTTRAGRPA